MNKVCVDRLLKTPKARIAASKTAIAENPSNKPDFVPPHLISPLGLALLTDRKWPVGRTIECYFMEGYASQKKHVESVAHTIEEFANLKFKFTDNPKSDIRIAFMINDGSWSYISMDATDVSFRYPTMNFGWLDDAVILHEFMHGGAAALHEHSSPAAGMKWNKPVVYAALAESPNFWKPEDVDTNVFELYSKEVTQYSAFDPHSIQLYSFPAEWTLDGFSAPWNQELSLMDKQYLRKFYPFSDIIPNSVGRKLMLPQGVVKQLNLILSPDEVGKYKVEVSPDRDSWLSMVLPNGVHAFGKNPIEMTLPAGKTIVKLRNDNLAGNYIVSAKIVN